MHGYHCVSHPDHPVHAMPKNTLALLYYYLQTS